MVMEVLYTFRLLEILIEDRESVPCALFPSYLARRVIQEPANGNAILNCVRRLAIDIHKTRDASNTEVETMEKCFLMICSLSGTCWWESQGDRTKEILTWDKDVDEEDYEQYLFAAAIRTDNVSLVRKCVSRNEQLMTLLERFHGGILIFGRLVDLASKYGGKDVLACLMTTGVMTVNQELRWAFLRRAAEDGRADIFCFVRDFKREEVPWDFSVEAGFRGQFPIMLLDTPSLGVLKAVECFRKQCTDVRHDAWWHSFLGRAVRGGQLETVKYAIQMGAHPEGVSIMGDRGNAPMRDACEWGHTPIVEYLLGLGMKTKGMTAIAVAEGHIGLVRRLLKLDPAPPDALSKAAAQGRLDMVRLLLDAGVDVDETGGSKSPLAIAVSREHKAMFELLIERGVNIHAKGIADECLECARRDGLESMLLLLEAHGVSTGGLGYCEK